MNIMQILNVIAFFIYIFLIIILLIKLPKFKPAYFLSLFLFCFMVWSFFTILFFSNSISENTAFLYINFASFGWIYLSSIMLIFILVFTKKRDIIAKKYLLIFLFGLPILFVIAQWRGLMSVPVMMDFGWRAIWKNTIWSYLFFTYTFVFNAYSVYLGINMIKTSQNKLRIKQMKIIIYGGAIAFVLTFISDVFLSIVLNITNIPNFGSILGVLWGVFSVYGLVKYKELDILPEFVTKNIINTMFDCLIIVSIKKHIIFVNNAVIKSYGFTEVELKGMPLNILLKNKSDEKKVFEAIDIKDGFNNIETVFRTKDDIDVDVLISYSTIINKIGVIDGIVCVIKDVTEIKKNEKIKDVLLNISEASIKIKNLKELSIKVHQQIGLLMDAENFYIALIKDEENGIYTFPYVVDINPEEYIAPDIPTDLKKGLTHLVFRTKKPFLIKDYDDEIILKENEVDMIGIDSKSWLGVPLKVTDDKIIGVIVLQSYSDSNRYSIDDLNVLSIISNTIASVIEHWENEKNLIHLGKMEVIGKLAGGVAHDLNNVLGAIVSYPDIILKKLPNDSPLKRTVLTIQQSGLKAAAIVQDLLTLARRGVSIDTIENLNEIIIDYLETPVFEKLKFYYPKVKIETKLDKNIPNIKGSFLHISKTIMNLVSNAAESIVKEGSITIITELISLNDDLKGYYSRINKGDYIVLKIIDTGSGITELDLNKIFEPFYTKKKMGRSGTGLGMAVVWGTVEDHKGFIDVKSIVGKGTSFELYFPITNGLRIIKSDSANVLEYTGTGERILIIDDEETQREISLTLLNELGYSVFTVSSGENAIKFLEKNSVDLCILDMIMDPGIDGLDTYKKIIKIHPNIKVVIVSGYSESDRVKEALSLGANSYVSKPYTIERIGIAIKNLL